MDSIWIVTYMTKLNKVVVLKWFIKIGLKFIIFILIRFTGCEVSYHVSIQFFDFATEKTSSSKLLLKIEN